MVPKVNLYFWVLGQLRKAEFGLDSCRMSWAPCHFPATPQGNDRNSAARPRTSGDGGESLVALGVLNVPFGGGETLFATWASHVFFFCNLGVTWFCHSHVQAVERLTTAQMSGDTSLVFAGELMLLPVADPISYSFPALVYELVWNPCHALNSENEDSRLALGG